MFTKCTYDMGILYRSRSVEASVREKILGQNNFCQLSAYRPSNRSAILVIDKEEGGIMNDTLDERPDMGSKRHGEYNIV